MDTFLLCMLFFPNLLHGQMTAIIKYEYYNPTSNYLNINEENQTNGIVATQGSQLPVRNGQAFILVDSKKNYDACQQPINTLNYSNGIAIIQRGGDCTFSVKITRAKQRGAAAVIIYDPRSDGQDVVDMLQNNSDILALYVSRTIGSILFDLASDNQTYLNITLEPINSDNDNSNSRGLWYNSRGAIIFVAVSICILVGLFVAWFIFYYCQRYRLRTAKNHLQNRLTHAAKKALTKIPLVTIAGNSTIEESCVICLDTIKIGDIVRQLKCTHTFHQTCVDPWLINHRHCPLCNLDILVAYGISIPGTNSRRNSVQPDNSIPIAYTSLATSAATPIFEQNNLHNNEQQRQTSINMQHQSIPTISSTIRDNIHGEQNSIFRSDDDH
ncbi:unnamed protein product [Adineta steineri]|uniref:RING-type domain-containing protein n=1 Tax=Adineta steineri TaxID=433720 RepID=A0A818NM39_9BILA|nr:unnamed protein product [Adineta steineri]CAF3609105.1 unnamed protein product [Adineta steineri]